VITRRRMMSRAAIGGAAGVFSAAGAVRGSDVLYVGGTIDSVPEKTEGRLDSSGEGEAVFQCKKGSFRIPYQTISSLEYGQKAGRRVGVAIAISPLALLSKKRRHYLSLAYLDPQGAKQGVVFELSKGRTHSLISMLEARSGKKVEFESAEAQKHYEKEAR
jgi:hypothetical protein